MLEVEKWAEIRRMSRVEGLSQREISKKTGLHRSTVKRALETTAPPSYGPRRKRPSKLDPFRTEIEDLLRKTHDLSGVRILEEIGHLGYTGSKTILDDLLRELRPRYAPPPRTYQKTVYRPGELAQFDLMELKREIPVGWGQTRKGYLLTAKLPFSRMFAAAPIFSKRFEDISWGMNQCLTQFGALPEKVVVDREGALHKGGGHPTDIFAAWLGQMSLGWIILDAGDAQAKGSLERNHRHVHGNLEAGRSFINPLDLLDQVGKWLTRANSRTHSKTKRVISEHFAEEKLEMEPLPKLLPDTDYRQVIRIPAQPYLRLDTNDYSLDPRLVGRRVEVRASQETVTATELGTGQLACQHTRHFAKGLTFTDPAHQEALDQMRRERKNRGPKPRHPEVEIRPLARYDQLIGA